LGCVEAGLDHDVLGLTVELEAGEGGGIRKQEHHAREAKFDVPAKLSNFICFGIINSW